ncbi:CRISPR-associated Cas4 family protein [Aeropyrum camini SY1 = JCM 12091]|uniref:CRISPR-associated exonuclease Cas4 n=1 Tax=Aeropyrum camini SY1 = JCM 12091 TaxID=1198449 RepID=U3TG15_9CREN|nr:CRISPR-associated Cas4 family protein [Aeropyrum camini SY1 = JCM 12091]
MRPVSMLKEYAYCPRVAYYMEVLRPSYRPTEPMNLSREIYSVDHVREILRTSGFRIVKEEWAVPLRSKRLGLQGVADGVVVEGRLGIVVVEAKLSVRSNRWLHTRDRHVIFQAAAYALALEETRGYSVDYLAIVSLEDSKTYVVRMSPSLRRDVIRLADDMNKILDDGLEPPPKPGRKCVACRFRRVCQPWVAGRGSERLY